MKNFNVIECEELMNTSRYEYVEESIYKDVKDEDGFSVYRIAIEYELETGENNQYPLEDLLDHYYVHIEVFLDCENESNPRYILGGELEDVRKIKGLLGKRVYNREYLDEEGQVRVELIIE